MSLPDALAPPPDLGFGDVLEWHLMRGTRPPGSDRRGEPWKKAAFAEQVGVSDKQVRNWIASTSLPNTTIAIERVLFGRSQQHAIALRMQLRDSLKRARQSNVKIPSKTPPKKIFDLKRLPDTFYERLVGRNVELVRLDEAWAKREINIISVVAEGGAGKSALVNEWLINLQYDDYRGAEVGLAWSFYSQGTIEHAATSDEFLDWALERLDLKIATTNAIVKADCIAEALMRRRVLLLLDGVEPLQHGPGPQLGQLKDQGLRALLRRLAGAPGSEERGLVVITSRLIIRDIASWRNGAAPIIELDRLCDEAATTLLQDSGVSGTDREIREAADEFDGHPLALQLLGSFLRETQGGDVRRRDLIRSLLTDTENPNYDHVRRVMESYKRHWLARQPLLLVIMRIVGLFDRPADGACLAALRASPVIIGLTDEIGGLDGSIWRRAVTSLREARLLAPADTDDIETLDTHPLIREWFGNDFKQSNLLAFRAAHSRLYEHLRDTTTEAREPTLDDLAPLYQSIAHGVRAGRHQEALDDVFRRRICRLSENGALEYYSTFKLGAVGSDLEAISCFFDKPFDKTSDHLIPADQAWVMNEATYDLSALGRLLEAVPIQRTLVGFYEAVEDWKEAAINASNLSQTELLLGNASSALEAGIMAVSFADKSKDFAEKFNKRTTQANALNALGRSSEALELFVLAEELKAKHQPESPLLSSFWGYRYCDLLLDAGRWDEASEHASQTIALTAGRPRLIDLALDKLTLGRAKLGRELGEAKGASKLVNVELIRKLLDDAIAGLRTATTNHICGGLLARASFFRSAGHWSGAFQDLNEVEEFAESRFMRLYLCDLALERARLALARSQTFAPLTDSRRRTRTQDSLVERIRLKGEAAKQLTIAASYITECGYHRRDRELLELQSVLADGRSIADLPPRA